MRFIRIETFECDLTEDQKRLSEWIAEQAQMGRTRIYYEDAQAMLGIHSEQKLTDLLRSMRERLDDIHNMVLSPIVNTIDPYFDIREDADHIWNNYRQAEEEAQGPRPRPFRVQDNLVHCGSGGTVPLRF